MANVFLFQSVSDRFDLRKEIQPGANDTWYATRYRKDMHKGDVVFFWMGGDPTIRGIYGWGNITSEPYMSEGWTKHGVNVTYRARFDQPLLATAIQKDPVLAEMLIFRTASATNFLLNDDEAVRLIGLVRSRGENVPAISVMPSVGA